MKFYILIIIVFLGACSSTKQSFPNYVTEQILENVTDSELGYSKAACNRISNQCSALNYQQWRQANGEIACSCKN